MQGLGYTYKIWFSGIILTPILYSLILILTPGLHIPASFASLIINSIIPYTLMVSVWMALGIFCTLSIFSNYPSAKLYLCIAAFIIAFSGFTAIYLIHELMSYSANYLLALVYATITTILILVCPPKINTANPTSAIFKNIRYSFIYSLSVWLFTFLLSSPLSVFIWRIVKSYPSASLIRTGLDIVERYNIQFNVSSAYCITVFLACLSVICLDLPENKKKAIITLFAFPLSFPVLFYYLIFSGNVLNSSVFDLIVLVIPSLIVCIASIWLIDIVPKAKIKP